MAEQAQLPRVIWLCAALSAALAVAAGAFGAHGASSLKAADWLRTGGLYQMVHAVAALAIARLYPRIATALLAGAAIFALTLYAMALGAPSWFGAITPIGGVVMVCSWLTLCWTQFRRPV